MSWPRASTPWRSSLAHLGFGVALSGFAQYCSFFCCRFAAPLPSHWALIKVGLYQCMVQSTLKADWKGISHMSQWCQSTKTFCSGWHHILFQHCKRRRIACVLTTYVALFIVSPYLTCFCLHQHCLLCWQLWYLDAERPWVSHFPSICTGLS